MTLPQSHCRTHSFGDNGNALWWRLPELEQEPYRREYIEEQLDKQSIDKIVLDYFIQEGFYSAAQALALEAGIKLDEGHIGANFSANDGTKQRFSTIVNRKEIKLLILEGNIMEAIRVIGKYFPIVLDAQPRLLFSLLRLNLIEMIRDHKSKHKESDSQKEEAFLNKVLEFVRENMIGKVSYSPSLLKDLETTMSLLCFDFDPSKPVGELTELPPKLRELFNLSLRRECYREVNRAILELSDHTTNIQYNGAPLEFTPAELQKLKEWDEDTDMENSDDEEIRTNGKDIKIPSFDIHNSESHPTESDGSEYETGKVVDKNVLRSQLERITILWLATQRKVDDLPKEPTK
ncbi:hypothetical protein METBISCDRAFT_21126 [Metschnikowia bicuspidata]|uniref:CTLH domain-containing protein n=1 Tax=Metschnikowia bicuspidata TaxID=27322 RepID=A0A4P9ZIL3_9ASCO|nr:hypothetical protein METBISCDRAFT_21126 [Metschnikowia bicuspidata]